MSAPVPKRVNDGNECKVAVGSKNHRVSFFTFPDVERVPVIEYDNDASHLPTNQRRVYNYVS